MKASEIKIGEACRHRQMGCRRVQPPEDTDKVWLVTNDDKLVIVEPDAVVRSAFDFEGPGRPEDDDAMLLLACDSIYRMKCLMSFTIVEEAREERMKAVAAEILKPGTDETIKDLWALDYIWNLRSNQAIRSGQVYYHRVLDYYLGRKVRHHRYGDGRLLKIAYEYGDKRLPLEHEYYNAGRVWLSDPAKEHNLPGRGIHYGIHVNVPCVCGKAVYGMFAIPGSYTGAFAYLVTEETDHYLDIRNHNCVCEACCCRPVGTAVADV